MSIFLDENFMPVYDMEFLNETGLISFIKKFYTGKDKKEIEEFKRELNRSDTHSQIQDVIDDINESIEDVDDFRKNSTLARFFGHGIIGGIATAGTGALIAGVSAAAANLWFKNGSAKKALLRHRDELEAVKRDAYKKLEKVKL